MSSGCVKIGRYVYRPGIDGGRFYWSEWGRWTGEVDRCNMGWGGRFEKGRSESMGTGIGGTPR